jgi:hypothetical protein
MKARFSHAPAAGGLPHKANGPDLYCAIAGARNWIDGRGAKRTLSGRTAMSGHVVRIREDAQWNPLK